MHTEAKNNAFKKSIRNYCTVMTAIILRHLGKIMKLLTSLVIIYSVQSYQLLQIMPIVDILFISKATLYAANISFWIHHLYN